MLAIVDMLKEYRNFLLGAEKIISQTIKILYHTVALITEYFVGNRKSRSLALQYNMYKVILIQKLMP